MRIIDLQKKYYTKTPPLDLDLLLASAIGQAKEFLYSHPEYRLSIIERVRLRYFVFLFKKGYSVAAITKHKEFYGLDFFVNKNVLIPRPETEMMVEEVIRTINCHAEFIPASREIPNQVRDDIVLIDVGTGSGCVPISILKTLNHERIKALATDISRAALRVAKKNAKTHNVNIKFFHGNLLKPIIHNPQFKIHNSVIVITANLPYLTEKQFQNEPSIQREPKKALVADNNGLALYEELFEQISQLVISSIAERSLTPDGRDSSTPLRSGRNDNIVCFLEIDPSQTQEISKLILKYLPNSKTEIQKDLCGRDRLVKITN